MVVAGTKGGEPGAEGMTFKEALVLGVMQVALYGALPSIPIVADV